MKNKCASWNFLRIKKKIMLGLILLFSVYTTLLKADEKQYLSIPNKTQIIDTILTCFEVNYVYPKLSKSMKDSILLNNKNGKYREIKTIEELLTNLSSDFRKITNDAHINMSYIEKSDYENRQNKHSLLSKSLEEKKRKNFNFRKVEWLPGNIGYLRFDIFEDPQYAGETFVSAMQFLSNCDAIIVDLRYNYGGEEKMVKFLSSYFFTEPTLLNSRYFTKQDSVVQSWTYSYVPGKKLINKDIYILTSSNTASGAEAFAYILKNYKKALIIGEPTRGAAHWVEYFYFPSIQVEIKLPVARPINPITRTNWEKTGVPPDIEVAEFKALDMAYLTALSNLMEKNPDKSKQQELEWYYKIIQAKFKNEMISETDFIEYAGEYGDVKFFYKDGYVFWDQGENVRFVLIPITKDIFTFDDSDDYLVKFIRNQKDKVIGYQLLKMGREDNPIHNKTGNIKN